MEAWQLHTDRTNPTKPVVAEVRRRCRPALCTQAWCKFYEILDAHPLINGVIGNGSDSLRTLHLCEAPGAFISALHYWLAMAISDGRLSARPFDWQWVAQSLNPHYEGNSATEMITDDSFICATIDQWDFGIDNTGDLTHWANITDLIRKHTPSLFHLITADGSVDCLDVPDEQEAYTFRLHFCEVSVGGDFVLISMLWFFIAYFIFYNAKGYSWSALYIC